jgi:hypothetical protein
VGVTPVFRGNVGEFVWSWGVSSAAHFAVGSDDLAHCGSAFGFIGAQAGVNVIVAQRLHPRPPATLNQLSRHADEWRSPLRFATRRHPASSAPVPHVRQGARERFSMDIAAALGAEGLPRS